MATRKPLVLIGGKPRQLGAGDSLDVPPTTGAVQVRLADNSTRNVAAVTTGPWAGGDASGKLDADFNTLADGVSPTGTDWFPIRHGGLNLKLAWSAMVNALGLSSKLDADFSTAPDAGPGQDADLVPIRRAAGNRRLSLSGLASYLTGVARSWAGKQTFSGGAALGELSPTVKMKVLTGVMSSTAGATTAIAHDLGSGDVIVGVIPSVKYNNASGANDWIQPGYSASMGNSEFGVYWGNTNVILKTTSSASASVLGKPVRVVVFYTS